MIFVTVGTHEQQFNRLIKSIDDLKGRNKIKDEVVIQIGFSTYIPKYCQWYRLISYDDMVKYVKNARIVITHGGPASFLLPIQYGKTPIVVPRQYKYKEHINDHQLKFAKILSDRMKNIICIENIHELEHVVIAYDSVIENMDNGFLLNNSNFCNRLANIVDELRS